ncbi:hypothetical protein AB2B38_000550 [Balneola sp. MJW-20]|uniref:hypothetical protein n=1 Tax=Gracilimonas aurantiaca TaxID=3234185 RepID=UPI003465F6EA
MKRSTTLIGGLIIAVAITACEVPKSPDFTTSQKIEAPILLNKTYQMIGSGQNVFIDTTKSDFDSLFTFDGDNFITIAKDEQFDFGNLDDAIPTVSVSPTTFNAEVGSLEIGSFSSASGNLGEASFADLTGIGASPNQGDPVPPQTVSPQITIDLNTDRFESADFSSGALEIRLTNNLGFNLDDITVTLVSSPAGGPDTDIATDATPFLADGSEGVVVLDLAGQTVANPQVRVSINWTSPAGSPQTFQRSPQSLVVNNAEGVGLTASSITAALDPQSFNSSGNSSFSNSEFSFTAADHYVEVSSGQLLLQNIVNQMGVGVEVLEISFPGILAPPYDPSDSLVVSFSGANAIAANSVNPGTAIDLGAYRIYAQGDQIQYNINAITEDTQNSLVTITETDQVSADIGVVNLEISFARGIVEAQNVLLGDDDPSNGVDVLDLFNDLESQLTEIDGLADFSSKIDGFEFNNPSISFNYSTNIGVSTTVYGVIWGRNANNESLFLTGDLGSPFEVTASDPVTGLTANGSDIQPLNLIKFDVQSATDENNTSTASVTFDTDNTNVAEFLNNLPNEIRFIGKALINENGEEGFIQSPVEFDPTISVQIPLAFSTPDAATFSDTTEDNRSSFEDLPSVEKDDDYVIKEGSIILDYQNGLPLALDISINLLDENYNLITSIPDGVNGIQFGPAGVDANNFASGTFNDQLQISLSESQLQQLYKTVFIELNATVITNNNSEVRIRTSDSVSISARAELVVENEVKGN